MLTRALLCIRILVVNGERYRGFIHDVLDNDVFRILVLSTKLITSSTWYMVHLLYSVLSQEGNEG